MTTTAPAEKKTLSIVLLVIASILAMSLWFVSAAIVGDMSSESNMSPGLQAALSTAVQAGFVIGAVRIGGSFSTTLCFCVVFFVGRSR